MKQLDTQFCLILIFPSAEHWVLHYHDNLLAICSQYPHNFTDQHGKKQQISLVAEARKWTLIRPPLLTV